MDNSLVSKNYQEFLFTVEITKPEDNYFVLTDNSENKLWECLNETFFSETALKLKSLGYSIKMWESVPSRVIFTGDMENYSQEKNQIVENLVLEAFQKYAEYYD